MYRRFRICMAKEGRESLGPSYGLPKLTIISGRKKNTLSGVAFEDTFPYVYWPFHLLWPITIYLFVFELEAEE